MAGAATLVEEGEEVEAGWRIGVIEARKMESAISAPASGTIERPAFPSGTSMEPGDLLVVLRSS